ncbi:MAG: ATP synthase F1 subunit delta [Oscillospiraceae bacterium]|nr:ATP synthase F1 subunit delta [Oscillospiraceae bacterium]
MTAEEKVYGQALFGLCLDEGREDEVLTQLRAVTAIFEENPDYYRLLSLPSVTRAERIAALDESLGGRVDEYLLNFLKLLSDKGLIRSLKGCLAAYEAYYNAEKGILPARAVTARPMTEDELARLREKLEKMTGKTVKLSCETDPSLLGGVRLYMDGKVYDGTVRQRLRQIEKVLAETVI